MPTENCLRLDQHPQEGRTIHQLAQRRHYRSVSSIHLGLLELSAHDSKLVPEEKQFRLRIVDSQPHIEQIQEQPKPGVNESEEHRRSKCYRLADLTPGSLPADEYVIPTASIT